LLTCYSEAATWGRWLAACSPQPGHLQQVRLLGAHQHGPSVEQDQLGEYSNGQQGGLSTAARLGAARRPLTERNGPEGPGGTGQNLCLHRRPWKAGGLRAKVYTLFLRCSSAGRTCSAKSQGTQERCLLTLFIKSVSPGRSGFSKGYLV